MLNGRSPAAALWRRRWTVLLVVLLVAAATASWLLFAPRRYTATASVAATPSPALAGAHGTVSDLQSTFAALAESPPVLAEVAARLGRRSAATLRTEVQAEHVGGTALIRIHVEDADPHVAAQAANLIAAALPGHDPTRGQFSITNAGRAGVPTNFSTPDVDTVVIGAALAAVLLAVLAALLRERAAGRVDDRRQLEVLAGAPVLAALTRPADPNEMPAEAPSAQIAAEFRALRVGLEFASSDEPTSLVVVAPAVRDEAGAWTTVNLASALARVEHRVLIIDADFGATYPHPVLKSRGPGLADVLRGNVELRDAVRPTPISGVSVLPTGTLGGVAADTLVELRFHRAMAQIDKEVDVILVHTAPLADSDDALVMAAGHALLVTVPAGRIRAREVRDLAADLDRMRLRVVGSVLLRSR